jgi:hypothetical protein
MKPISFKQLTQRGSEGVVNSVEEAAPAVGVSHPEQEAQDV